MATIRKRKGKKQTSYFAEVCVKGVRKGASFDTRNEALSWAVGVEKGLRQGGYFGDEPAGGSCFPAYRRIGLCADEVESIFQGGLW